MTITNSDFDVTTAVGDIAAKMPSSTRIFQKFRIDYCCGGKMPLEDACARAGVGIDVLLEELEALQQTDEERNWSEAPLAELSAYIIEKHHIYTREETDALVVLANKVERVHGPNHPEVLEVATIVRALQPELHQHMMKEEQILFPFVSHLEQQLATGGSVPQPGFGTVQNPIRMMISEHDEAAEMLRRLREVTSDYTLPEGACMSFQALYFRLQELETDLHQHIHLENNVYFPRAVELEQSQFRTA